MAEAISVPENDFLCPVCLEILTDPVTIPCGHSYCTCCIKNCWDQDEEKDASYGCPQCRQTFTPRPILGRNTILADMVSKLKAQDLSIANLDPELAKPGDVECTVCIGRKRKADKSCLECVDSYCATHFSQHEELHAKKHKVVEAAVHLQKKMCLEHNKPLEAFCQTDSRCLCITCITEKHNGHDILSLASAKETNQIAQAWSLQNEISKRESELNRLTENVEHLKSSAQALERQSDYMFMEMQNIIEQHRLKVAQTIRTQEKAELSRADQLQEEIGVLKKRAADMAELAKKVDYASFLQNLSSFSPKGLPAVTVNDHFSFKCGKASKLISDLKDLVKGECEVKSGFICRYVQLAMFREIPRKQLMKYFQNLKFDRFTAYRNHLLSEEYTKVEWTWRVVSRYGDTTLTHFTECEQVLCSESFSGCAYWEVEWESRYGISIAVVYGDIDRKGPDDTCRFGRNKGSWSLDCSNSSVTFCHNNMSTEISGPSPGIVGVYLNHQEGTLSFYSIDPEYKTIADLIYRTQARFTKPLYPAFYLSSGSITLLQNGKNEDSETSGWCC